MSAPLSLFPRDAAWMEAGTLSGSAFIVRLKYRGSDVSEDLDECWVGLDVFMKVLGYRVRSLDFFWDHPTSRGWVELHVISDGRFRR